MTVVEQIENWRPVRGYEDAYEVSDLGNVRSLDRIVEGGRGPRTQRGRRIAKNRHRGGYDVVHLYSENQRTARFVHHLVLEAFIGERPDGMEACHGPGGPSDNRVSNLRWDTHSENNRDQVRQGTHPWASKPTCPLGHSLISPNLSAYAAARGERRCLACQRAYRLKSAGFSAEIADQKYREIMAMKAVEE